MHTPTEHEHTPQQSLLRLMQLVSPALPVGAFAYSQAQEYAVERQWVHDESSAQDWLCGLLVNSLARLDVPVLVRLYQAWQSMDRDKVRYWNAFLFACRESAELQQEDRQLGRSLARLLVDLDIDHAKPWLQQQNLTFASMFSLASVQWQINSNDMLYGYLWAWLENQVAAAIKLVPLGQTAGQRILLNVSQKITQAIEQGVQLDDRSIGFSTPGLAIASAMHETQYTRLFRS